MDNFHVHRHSRKKLKPFFFCLGTVDVVKCKWSLFQMVCSLGLKSEENLVNKQRHTGKGYGALYAGQLHGLLWPYLMREYCSNRGMKLYSWWGSPLNWFQMMHNPCYCNFYAETEQVHQRKCYRLFMVPKKQTYINV